MLQTGAIDNTTFQKARDDTLNQSVQGRPAMQLAPNLRAGSQEAYAALVGAQNSAQERALKEQQKQITLQQEANNIARDVKVALDELKEVMPGKGN